MKRLALVAARVLLWGCVLLLLVRGVLSILHTDSRIPTRGVATVMQLADTASTNAQRR